MQHPPGAQRIPKFLGPCFRGSQATGRCVRIARIWLLTEHGHLNLAFIEEMFPDDGEKYRRVREVLSQFKLET